MSRIKASCTWGDGPDVLVSFENHPFILHEGPKNDPPPRGQWFHGYVSVGSFDLTADQAIKLSYQLKAAARTARKLDQSIREHENGSRSKNTR